MATPLHTESTARGMLFRHQSVLVSAARGESFWILPGGHIDPGESAQDAVVREWGEELGVCPTQVEPYVLVHAYWRRGGDLQGDRVHERLHLFLITDTWNFPTGIFRGPEISLRFQWVPVGQLLQYHVVPQEAHQWIVRAGGGASGTR